LRVGADITRGAGKLTGRGIAADGDSYDGAQPRSDGAAAAVQPISHGAGSWRGACQSG